MSTYFEMFGSTIDAPDPDSYTKMEADPGPVGRFSNGQPVIQGRESGVVTWNVMSLSDYHDLYDVWDTDKDNYGDFVVPPHSGDDWDTWRTVSAYCEPPTCEYRGNQVHNVRLVIREAPSS